MVISKNKRDTGKQPVTKYRYVTMNGDEMTYPQNHEASTVTGTAGLITAGKANFYQ